MVRPEYELGVKMYCDKCGNIVTNSIYIYDGIDEERICSICHNELKRIPKKYFRKRDDGYINNWEKRRIRKKLVMPSPNFDQYYFDHRDELLAKQEANRGYEVGVDMYCDKCGHVTSHSIYIYDGVDKENTCEICHHNRLKRLPKGYRKEGSVCVLPKEVKQRIREELVKTSINFDPYYFDNYEQLCEEAAARVRSIHTSSNNSNSKGGGGAKCPFCGSASISSISTVNRAASIGMFGIASGKIGKTDRKSVV